jgi:ABC-type proline/glycine betaine transport system substrate-binding protein
MKKLIVGAAVAATLFAGAYAFAAGLTVDSNDLAAGTGSVAACQALTDKAHVQYSDVAWLGGEYVVNQAKVVFDGEGCDGQTVELTLMDGTNGSLFQTLPVTVDATDNTATFVIDSVQADQIENAAVVVTGDQPTP